MFYFTEMCIRDRYINMYGMLVEKLKIAGYEHYEISNFSLPGKRARHNSSYWTGEKYLGLGAGAHSFNGVSRRINFQDVIKYIEDVYKRQPLSIAPSQSPFFKSGTM